MSQRLIGKVIAEKGGWPKLNWKSKARNPKQIQMTKVQMIKASPPPPMIRNGEVGGLQAFNPADRVLSPRIKAGNVSNFEFWSFEFVSSFAFRISDSTQHLPYYYQV
jgi:hypothetical protein